MEALKVSSDTYFFTVGETDNGHGNVIQNMANKLGIGQPTEIDLPNQAEGVVPDAPVARTAEPSAGKVRTPPSEKRMRLRRGSPTVERG